MTYPTINFNGAFITGQKIPKVKGTGGANEYPTPPNTEVVLLDSDDDTILYIKQTDANGYGTVTRCRYYEDPEPTQQEINDMRYITIDEFNKFKEEMLSAIRSNQSGYNTESNKKNENNYKQQFKSK